MSGRMLYQRSGMSFSLSRIFLTISTPPESSPRRATKLSAHRLRRTDPFDLHDLVVPLLGFAPLETAPAVFEIGVVLLLAVGAGSLARRLGLPAVLGYLAAGLVVSPLTPGYAVDR